MHRMGFFSNKLELITSEQNGLIKKVLRLQQKSRSRKKEGLFIVEGWRELTRAAVKGYTIEQLIIHEEWIEQPLAPILTNNTVQKCFLKSKLFEKISLRSGSEKIMAIVHSKSHELKDFQWSAAGIYLLIERVEKPGNLGAMLRTAAGAGISGVFLVDSKTDLYSPNCIRNSLGGVFSLPIAHASSHEICEYLNQKNCPIWAATLHDDALPYHQIDYTTPGVIAVGSESDGLSEFLVNQAQQKIILPMHEPIDSLNVSVAAGILMYHALHQQKQ